MFSCNESEIYACVVLQLIAVLFKLRFVQLTSRLAAFVQRKWNFRNAEKHRIRRFRDRTLKACWWAQSICRWFYGSARNQLRNLYDRATCENFMIPGVRCAIYSQPWHYQSSSTWENLRTFHKASLAAVVTNLSCQRIQNKQQRR